MVTHELKFTAPQSDEITVSEYGHLEVHETIEELMVVANSVVAQRIFAQFPTCALLRKHDAPPEDKLKRLTSICGYLGTDINTTNNYTFAKSILNIQQTSNQTMKDMLMLLFRKCENRGNYNH